jgi:type IV secretory pathway component VirB8
MMQVASSCETLIYCVTYQKTVISTVTALRTSDITSSVLALSYCCKEMNKNKRKITMSYIFLPLNIMTRFPAVMLSRDCRFLLLSSALPDKYWEAS